MESTNSSNSNNRTVNNQEILRVYGEKITELNAKSDKKATTLYSLFFSFLPTPQIAGKKIGDNLAITYGAQWSNSAIDLVVGKFFKKENPTVSMWSFQGLAQYFKGGAQKTLSETLKLTLTPKLMPYITLLCGVTGQVTLPLAVSLISFAYQKCAGNPQQIKQLSALSLDQLFTLDEESGRLRDAFGYLLNEQDMQDIATKVAQYTIVCKLIDLNNEINKLQEDEDIDELEIDSKAEELLRIFTNDYYLERSDGVLVFPDGQLVKKEDTQRMSEGIGVLSRLNPAKKSEEIHALIDLLAKHSIPPFKVLTSQDEEKGEIRTAHMPSIFKGDNEWKNFIVRDEDGSYHLSQTMGERKKGWIIPKEELKTIFYELHIKERQLFIAKQNELHNIIENPETRATLSGKLNQMSSPNVKEFFESFIITREEDNEKIYPNGNIMTEKDQNSFSDALKNLKKRQNTPERKEQINGLIKFIVEIVKPFSIEKNQMNEVLIKCADGVYITRTGETVPEELVALTLKNIEIMNQPVEVISEVNEKGKEEELK